MSVTHAHKSDTQQLSASCSSMGFFLAAQALGGTTGDPTGPEARAFHALQLQSVLSFYRR
jgi:hypothetical protein